MPKMLENIREQLLNETRKQILQRGYTATTMRSIAEACNIAVGTVYNYFPSKDMMIAVFVFEDWQKAMQNVRCDFTEKPKELLLDIYNALRDFSAQHNALFEDSGAKKVFYSVFSQRHAQLRAQISNLIIPICKNDKNPEFLSQFIAEALLTWTMAGTPFDELYSAIKKLI